MTNPATYTTSEAARICGFTQPAHFMRFAKRVGLEPVTSGRRGAGCSATWAVLGIDAWAWRLQERRKAARTGKRPRLDPSKMYYPIRYTVAELMQMPREETKP